MKIERVNLFSDDGNELNNKVLPLLKEKVFHVTSFKSYKNIYKDGYIKSNKDNLFEYTYPQSENSYGRKKGYICLIDLRNKSKEQIENGLMKYYFLHPVWHEEKIAFLILSKKAINNLIYEEQALNELGGYKGMWIPKLECWYSEQIPLKFIEQCIIVKIPVEVKENKTPADLIKHAYLQKIRSSESNAS